MKKQYAFTLAFFLLLTGWNCTYVYDFDSKKAANNKYGIVATRKNKTKWCAKPDYESIIKLCSERYFSAKKNGKWGIISRNEKIVVRFVYDTIFSSEMFGCTAFAKQNGKYAVILTYGKFSCTKAEYDTAYIVTNAGEDFETYTFLQKNKKMGLLSASGNVVMQPVYDSIVCSAGDDWHWLVLFKSNGKWGIADRKGKFVTEPLYDSISVCTTVATNEGARFAWLNDSVAYFDKNQKPFKGKIPQDLHDDLKNHWGGEKSVGCKRCK